MCPLSTIASRKRDAFRTLSVTQLSVYPVSDYKLCFFFLSDDLVHFRCVSPLDYYLKSPSYIFVYLSFESDGTTICSLFFLRDDLIEVLRAMLAMHLYPRRDDDEDEGEDQGGKGATGGGGAVAEDGIEGVPRVLTADQVSKSQRCCAAVELTIVDGVNSRSSQLREEAGVYVRRSHSSTRDFWWSVLDANHPQQRQESVVARSQHSVKAWE